MGGRPMELLGRALRKAGTEILRRRGITGTWIDVGAHHGETTLNDAKLNPGLTIYALEPNLTAVAKLVGQAPNYLVLPMAVSEKDGVCDFQVNKQDQASSLLALDEEERQSWKGGATLEIESVRTVATIRLDTLMRLLEINSVDYLKVDAQGMDLAVVKSAGKRLGDIAKIKLEVALTDKPLYCGAGSKEEVTEFLQNAGFQLMKTEEQTFGQEANLTFVRMDGRRVSR